MMFLSQRSYMVVGTLRDQLFYPHHDNRRVTDQLLHARQAAPFGDAQLAQARGFLVLVLLHAVEHVDQEAQRIAHVGALVQHDALGRSACAVSGR